MSAPPGPPHHVPALRRPLLSRSDGSLSICHAAVHRCTAHCDSMWYCRTCPGVIQGFATAIGTPDLTAAYDRMSINLPTSSNNPVALERAAQTFEHGKFGVMQRIHTHKIGYYDERAQRVPDWRARVHRLLRHRPALGHEQGNGRDCCRPWEPQARA